MIYEILDGNLLEYGINRGSILEKTKEELINIININNEYFEKKNERNNMNIKDDIDDLKWELNNIEEELCSAEEEIDRLESNLEYITEERDNYKFDNTYKIIRENGVFYIAIIRTKANNKYKFINITKEHICDCEFDSIEKAVRDLNKYKKDGKIINYFKV